MNVNNSIKEIVSFWSSVPQAIKKLVIKTTVACENRYYGSVYERFYKGRKAYLKGAFWFFLLKGVLWIGVLIGAYIGSK